MQALVLTHVAFEDPGSLSQVLAERGFSVRTLDACTADLSAIAPLEPELLIVMGGPIGVYESQAYPFVTQEIALLERRLRAQRATLGICLGAQLMAAALGAAVYAGKNGKEIGWGPLLPGADAGACAAMSELLGSDLQVLHWHGDTFELPPGASHLAATRQYAHQAFALGSYALALQFHPEVDAIGLERWYVGHACELAAARVDVAQLRAAAARHAPPLQHAARRFWRRWLETAL